MKASTRETYEHAIKHLNGFFGKRLICDIDAPEVAAYQKAREAEKAAGATVNKEFTVLASILADHNLWNGIRRDAKRASLKTRALDAPCNPMKSRAYCGPRQK